MSTVRTKGIAVVEHVFGPHTVDIFKSDLENTILFNFFDD